jgi:ABC-type multidrug transport system fused ATPase/permease subunit
MFINDVILGKKFSMMLPVVAGYCGVFLITGAIKYLRFYSDNRLINNVTFRSKLRIWKNYFAMDFEEYNHASSGDMKMRLEDDSLQIKSFADLQTINYAIAWVTAVATAVLLFRISWQIALFALIIVPLTFYLDHVVSGYEKRINEKSRQNSEGMMSWLHASLQGWREIRALAIERSQERQFIGYMHNFAIYNGKWINFWVLRVMIIPKLKEQFFMQFGLYFLGGFLIIGGRLTIGNLLVSAAYFGMMFNAVNTISGADAELQANMPLINRLLETLSTKKYVADKKGSFPHIPLVSPEINEIVFENVSYSYPNTGKEVLRDFNLKIHKGDRLAITGESGGGKTTLLKLMTAMLSPTNGTIKYSGVDLQNIDRDYLYRKVGFVMQENRLFNTSIRENLLYGKADACENELISACRKAYLLDFIDGLPQTFDTIIGERGVKLSGGQRQRIVLARLFLRDVDLFIFDEATSSLDQFSENIIQDVIRTMPQDKTIIVVAHRESSIAVCSRKIII